MRTVQTDYNNLSQDGTPTNSSLPIRKTTTLTDVSPSLVTKTEWDYDTLASGVLYTTSGTTQPIGSLTSVSLASGDSDTFGYDTLTGRLTSYTFNMNGVVAKSGGFAWNANGSLGQLELTDNLTPGNSQTCSRTCSH